MKISISNCYALLNYQGKERNASLQNEHLHYEGRLIDTVKHSVTVHDDDDDDDYISHNIRMK